jgi:hypothetical protein
LDVFGRLILDWVLDIHALCQAFNIPNLVQVVQRHLTIVSVQDHAFNLLANEFHGIGVELIASLGQRVNGSAKLRGFT